MLVGMLNGCSLRKGMSPAAQGELASVECRSNVEWCMSAIKDNTVPSTLASFLLISPEFFSLLL